MIFLFDLRRLVVRKYDFSVRKSYVGEGKQISRHGGVVTQINDEMVFTKVDLGRVRGEGSFREKRGKRRVQEKIPNSWGTLIPKSSSSLDLKLHLQLTRELKGTLKGS